MCYRPNNQKQLFLWSEIIVPVSNENKSRLNRVKCFKLKYKSRLFYDLKSFYIPGSSSTVCVRSKFSAKVYVYDRPIRFNFLSTSKSEQNYWKVLKKRQRCNVIQYLNEANGCFMNSHHGLKRFMSQIANHFILIIICNFFILYFSPFLKFFKVISKI